MKLKRKACPEPHRREEECGLVAWTGRALNPAATTVGSMNGTAVNAQKVAAKVMRAKR
jgi:hypothetical protein